jgi:hypothetical protein
MPKGATPLDFAYRIHSAVGNQCVGAKINGKIVPLDTPLATGDRVEILTSASSKGPGTDWLRICKTPQAKAKIRQFLKKELRQENLALGREMIEHECARRGVRLGDLAKPENYEGMLKKYGFAEFDDICCAVGYGGMAAQYVVSRLVEEQRSREAPALPPIPEEIPDVADEKQLSQRRANHGIVLTDNEDLDFPIHFARCCSPVPGDEIVGYICLGDITLYSSFGYVAEIIEKRGYRVDFIPGVSSISAAAAKSHTVLAQGNEKLLIMTSSALRDKDDPLSIDANKAIVKLDKHYGRLWKRMQESDEYDAVLCERVGLENERIISPLEANTNPSYLSLALIRKKDKGTI